MNNEEIRMKVLEHQAEIRTALNNQHGTFVLDDNILKHKKAIDVLRKQCSHSNPEGNFEFFNGACIYCGARQ